MVQKRQSTLIRRKQIIKAAQKLIARYGSEHVTVRRIAKEIGVSEGAIYRHFKNKRDIMSFLIDNIEDTLLDDIEVDYTDNSYTLETLERVMMNHISNIVQRGGASFQVMAEIISLGDKGLNKKIYDVINGYIGSIRDTLSEWVKAGVIRQDIDLDSVATLFFGMTQGLVNIWTLSQYKFNLEQKYVSLWHCFREILIKR